jgi:hypothetical protein
LDEERYKNRGSVRQAKGRARKSRRADVDLAGSLFPVLSCAMLAMAVSGVAAGGEPKRIRNGLPNEANFCTAAIRSRCTRAAAGCRHRLEKSCKPLVAMSLAKVIIAKTMIILITLITLFIFVQVWGMLPHQRTGDAYFS